MNALTLLIFFPHFILSVFNQLKYFSILKYIYIFKMSFFNFIKGKYENVYKTYGLTDKINSLVTQRNIKIVIWAFIISRVYRMYQLVYKS